MLTEIIMYVVLVIVAGDNIYQIWKLTRPGDAGQFKPAKILGYLVFTLVIVIFFSRTAQWGIHVSIYMWWIIAATTAAYAGVAIWRIVQNQTSKELA
ncbi:hypothetical protein ACTXN9_05535 [Corynebacterium casei]|uniref:Uncharacterized protein n=1 Tax=Corynebacterium casei LMG S-19264 TaxID=1285583 RepID=A0ABN4CD60_9CORY|nr:hypothetical protein [Corynebacterium casei]AHI20265.1 hypothetical protein CCASEI_08510 [Corynebacterium casei LMG S-19264]MDN5707227.1 hypothetical protein [Corynebacterium casei]MDN5784512.1 hypothetical protein [Corynebacterium casei]MDN5800184.1 hypothetical protein [Corynebacterium casei]MDN5826936.1 hypothetical protein [Corynebacterium casei]